MGLCIGEFCIDMMLRSRARWWVMRDVDSPKNITTLSDVVVLVNSSIYDCIVTRKEGTVVEMRETRAQLGQHPVWRKVRSLCGLTSTDAYPSTRHISALRGTSLSTRYRKGDVRIIETE